MAVLRRLARRLLARWLHEVERPAHYDDAEANRQLAWRDQQQKEEEWCM